MESGASTARACHPAGHPLHEQQFSEFLACVDASDIPEEQVMAYLRSLPLSTISAASGLIFERYDPSLRWPFQPVIDGDFIAARPIDTWQSGRWHRMPILTGFNINEGAMFISESIATSEAFTSFFHTLLPDLSTEDLDALDALYVDPLRDPSSPYLEDRDFEPPLGPQFRRTEAAYGQYAYIAPIRQTGKHASAAGPDVPVYLYRFAADKTPRHGADHCDHAAYVTYSEAISAYSSAQEQIAGNMHAYWTSYIVTGDPNASRGAGEHDGGKGERYAGRPHWTRYHLGGDLGAGAGSGRAMVFGEGNDELVGGVHHGVAAACKADTSDVDKTDFWQRKSELAELAHPE